MGTSSGVRMASLAVLRARARVGEVGDGVIGVALGCFAGGIGEWGGKRREGVVVVVMTERINIVGFLDAGDSTQCVFSKIVA